jgi:hypothetical protein
MLLLDAMENVEYPKWQPGLGDAADEEIGTEHSTVGNDIVVPEEMIDVYDNRMELAQVVEGSTCSSRP